jgi:WD40 repeat protein
MKRIAFNCLSLVMLSISLALNVDIISAQEQPQFVLSHSSEVKGANWSPDGNRIVSWIDGEAYIWDAQFGTPMLTIRYGGDFGSSLYGPSWSSDSQNILSWQEKTAQVWNINSGTPGQELTQDEDIDRAIWSPSGRLIVTWSSFFQTNSTPNYEIHLYIWDSGNGQQLATIRIGGAFLQGVSWSPDESKIFTLTSGEAGGIQAWKTSDGSEIAAFKRPGSLFLLVGELLWSKDHSRILISGINGEAYVVDANTGEEILSLYNDSWIWSAYWNPDENKIMGLLPNNRAIFIWDANTGEPILTLRHSDYVADAVWNKDGTRILTASSDTRTQNTIRVWNAQNGENLLSFTYASQGVTTRWDADEKFILGWFTNSSQTDGIGAWKVWDAITGAEILSGSQDSGLLGALSPLWSPTESRLLTWRGSEIRVWGL